MPGFERTDVRALFPMYQTPLQAAVLASSGITDFDQLEGKRMGVGAKTSFADTISGTDLIVGARSGSVQLLLYSVFRIGNPTKNVT